MAGMCCDEEALVALAISDPATFALELADIRTAMAKARDGGQSYAIGARSLSRVSFKDLRDTYFCYLRAQKKAADITSAGTSGVLPGVFQTKFRRPC